MIFLSHNSKDKPVVEQVALKLKGIYGQKMFFMIPGQFSRETVFLIK